MLKFAVTVNGVARNVSVLSRHGSELNLEIDSQTYTVSVSPLVQERGQNVYDSSSVTGAASARDRSAAGASIAVDPNSVVAPIPGAISSIKVSPGQTIAAGEVVLVLEAMKMENNIIAPFAGTVESIEVSKGEQVRKGQLLIKLAR